MEWFRALLQADNIAIVALASTNALTAYLLVKAINSRQEDMKSLNKLAEALTHIRLILEVIKDRLR